MIEPKPQAAQADAARVDTIGTRLVKVMLALLFLPILELWRPSRRLLGKARQSLTVVVYYHRVLSRERERFGRQMDMLLRWSTPIRASGEPPSLSTRAVLVTFDDGWQSFCEVALPELEVRQIPTLVSRSAVGWDRPSRPVAGTPYGRGRVARDRGRFGDHRFTHRFPCKHARFAGSCGKARAADVSGEAVANDRT